MFIASRNDIYTLTTWKTLVSRTISLSNLSVIVREIIAGHRIVLMDHSPKLTASEQRAMPAMLAMTCHRWSPICLQPSVTAKHLANSSPDPSLQAHNVVPHTWILFTHMTADVCLIKLILMTQVCSDSVFLKAL